MPLGQGRQGCCPQLGLKPRVLKDPGFFPSGLGGLVKQMVTITSAYTPCPASRLRSMSIHVCTSALLGTWQTYVVDVHIQRVWGAHPLPVQMLPAHYQCELLGLKCQRGPQVCSVF